MTDDLDARAQASSTATTSSTPGRRRRGLDLARDRRRARARRSGTTRASRYLDFSSQLVNVNIGHQHPAVVTAIQEQAATCSRRSRRRRPTSPAARRRSASCRHAPAGFRKVFFTNGGADANENAIRMARLHTGRDKVAVDLPLVPRQHRRGDRRDRRLAARCPTSTPADTCTSSARTCTAASSGRRRPSRSRERALHHLRARHPGRGPGVDRRDPAGDDPRHGRRPRAAARLPRRRPRARATGTGSC